MAALLEARRPSFNSLWPKQFHEAGPAGARKNPPGSASSASEADHRTIHATPCYRPSRLLDSTIRVGLRSWVVLVSVMECERGLAA